ncbi:MAG: SH3 domain-containing protein [Kineosporiaceae bacterium]
MPKGRHAAEPVRRPLLRSLPPLRSLPSLPRGLSRPLPRPLPRPLVLGGTGIAAAAVGGTVLAFSLGAVGPFPGTGGGTVQPVAADAGVSSPDSAVDTDSLVAAFEARELAQASRGAARSAPPTPAASPAPAESTAPAPEPPPVPAVVGQLWVTTDVNVRSGPSSDTERIGSLAALTQVDVTGAAENGWAQVVVEGAAGWVNSSYLSESEPSPEPAGVSGADCPISSDIESNLTANAVAVYRAVCAAFGDTVSSFGGYRPGDDGDHGSGHAVDVMVSGEPGWEIARYVQANAAELNVTYIIYEQQIWMAGDPASAWEWMEDRGGATANHYDHVHISVS